MASGIPQRPIYQKGQGAEKKSRKRLNQVSPKKAAYRSSQKGRDAVEYMGRVKALPCCICGCPGPSDAHHPICDRFGKSKVSDMNVIPLCETCHRYPHPNAIHTNKRSWVERHGPDHGYIEQTRKLVRQII